MTDETKKQLMDMLLNGHSAKNASEKLGIRLSEVNRYAKNLRRPTDRPPEGATVQVDNRQDILDLQKAVALMQEELASSGKRMGGQKGATTRLWERVKHIDTEIESIKNRLDTIESTTASGKDYSRDSTIRRLQEELRDAVGSRDLLAEGNDQLVKILEEKGVDYRRPDRVAQGASGHD